MHPIFSLNLVVNALLSVDYLDILDYLRHLNLTMISF